jgi:hypothetical protein
MTTIQAPYFPIIYVRGYAATADEIEDTVATPYMGFNLGATKSRQDHTGEINRFIFESPLLRLMKDEGYTDTYRDGDYVKDQASAKSVWIFRYYEKASRDLGDGKRRQMVAFAVDLRRFILSVRERVCGDDAAARRAFRVYLVAHSMGGLICRCYLQNLCLRGSGNTTLNASLELPGDHLVDKVFTYGTPHNGIDIKGFNVPDIGLTRTLEADTFNRADMADYLALKGKPERVDHLDGHFPPERFFCCIGTNYRDYTAFMGLARRGTGPMSDGLVMIDNAAVDNAPRAFVHRSHSGAYGLVNSEEGYQNLRRFLFGQIRVDARLAVDAITLPAAVEKAAGGHAQRDRINAAYYIETEAAVRGARYFLHQRRFDQSCALMRSYDQLMRRKEPLVLFTGYLHQGAKMPEANDRALAFQIRVALQVPAYEIDSKFWFDEHYPGDYIYDDTLTFEVRPRQTPLSISYGIASIHSPRRAPRRITQKDMHIGADGALEIEIRLGFEPDTKNPPAPGFSGRLLLRVSSWNQADADK